MGLFGIKKVDEKNNRSNTFFNDSVINAPDYSNMPNNNVVGYMQPMDSVQNVNRGNTSYNGNNINTQETFVFSQVNKNDYNNQFVNTDFNQVQNYSNNNVTQNNYNNMVSNDVVMQIPVNPNNQMNQISNNTFANNGGNVPYNQNINETIKLDNSSLVSLPNRGVVEEVQAEVLEEVMEEPKDTSVTLEPEPQVVLDPLNNGSNPIPVNPVAKAEEPKIEVVEEEQEEVLFDDEEEVKTNLFTVINMMFNVIIKPGTTISTNARRYKKIFDSLMVTFWVTMLSFVLSLVGRIIAGCFSTSYNTISGASKISLNFSGLVDINNYVPYLLITFIIGVVAVLVVGLTYYISSFVCSKGIHIGTYLAISTLSLVPVIIGFTIIHPIVSIISSSVALMILIFCIIYSLMILFTGMNEVLKFKNKDSRIIYNAINISIIFSIIVFIFEALSRMNILDLMILL